mmetsp:Transcript_5363/g.7735  ORF Transcript_5363/g.7735 Transcript_5363/m.7735 type:complete len:148 (+) Transcript_5363:160-603(+)|eukprot:CAMPEP_0194210648 /NCGR_PEP_ID=MMETSP0156-20130528/8903_1 /TAXON_ID=33649 /ORGANISM="Thalassionema nitzschioides, Strain L26-B" /LENGTH=147 /DNA_ID=CAMNT_0038938019 /DNA_START=86 /DNA_END=529 /DNA_ORIENTATION=-
MKNVRNNSLLLLASYLTACQAEDGADDGFMQNAFFKELYAIFPDIEQEWVVLVIFGSFVVVALFIAFFLIRCLCCRKGGRAAATETTAPYAGDMEYSKGEIPRSSTDLTAPVDVQYGNGASESVQTTPTYLNGEAYSGYYSEKSDSA